MSILMRNDNMDSSKWKNFKTFTTIIEGEEVDMVIHNRNSVKTSLSKAKVKIKQQQKKKYKR